VNGIALVVYITALLTITVITAWAAIIDLALWLDGSVTISDMLRANPRLFWVPAVGIAAFLVWMVWHLWYE
jgi:hypothetical protein